MRIEAVPGFCDAKKVVRLGERRPDQLKLSPLSIFQKPTRRTVPSPATLGRCGAPVVAPVCRKGVLNTASRCRPRSPVGLAVEARATS